MNQVRQWEYKISTRGDVKLRMLRNYFSFRRKITEKDVETKVLSLVEHAIKNVPFYQQQFQGKKDALSCFSSLSDYVQNFPVTHSSTYREHQQKYGHQELIDERLNIDELVEDRSSGSSGVPISVYRTKTESIYTNSAKTVYALTMRGLKPWNRILAIVPTLQVVESDFFLQKLGFFRRTTIDYRHSPEEVIQIIKKRRIDAIYGQAGYLRLLAEFYRDNRIQAPRLSFLAPGAEVVNSYTRRLFWDVFSPRHYTENYGTTETGIIATLNSDLEYEPIWNDCFFFVKEDDEAAERLGKRSGSIVLTSLNNYTQPILNLEVGDVVHLKNYFEGNLIHSKISGIEGRANDFLVLENGERLTGAAFYTLYEYYDFVKGFQIVQKAKGNCEINVALLDDLMENKNIILKATDSLLGKRIEYSLNFVDNIPLSSNGKQKILISEVQ